MDRVVDTLSAALERNGHTTKAVNRWFAEMPREEEMLPKDKYTLFDKKEKNYRKSIHSMFIPWLDAISRLGGFFNVILINMSLPELPKWTRVSQRVNPPGF